MNQFLKFADQVSTDQGRVRAILERAKSGIVTVGELNSLPEPQQTEARRLSWNAAWVPDGDPRARAQSYDEPEPRGFNSEIFDETTGRPTGGHEPWEAGE